MASRTSRPTAGKIADHLLGQRRLAAEQMGQPGDVQKQARRLVAMFNADQRTEAIAPGGQCLQRAWSPLPPGEG